MNKAVNQRTEDIIVTGLLVYMAQKNNDLPEAEKLKFSIEKSATGEDKPGRITVTAGGARKAISQSPLYNVVISCTCKTSADDDNDKTQLASMTSLVRDFIIDPTTKTKLTEANQNCTVIGIDEADSDTDTEDYEHLETIEFNMLWNIQ